MKILHLVIHPNLESSRVHKIWDEQISLSKKVSTTRHLYKEYPDFLIDIDKEQKDLIEHDKIIFQFPFYWYSGPALLKKYLDDVLLEGFAYGKGGDKLAGKKWQIITSIGSPEEAYANNARHNFAIEEFLRPFEQSALFCKMIYLPPMLMFNSMKMDEDTIRKYGELWIEKLINVV